MAARLTRDLREDIEATTLPDLCAIPCSQSKSERLANFDKSFVKQEEIALV